MAKTEGLNSTLVFPKASVYYLITVIKLMWRVIIEVIEMLWQKHMVFIGELKIIFMEMELKMPCPVCIDEGRYTESFSWFHSKTNCVGNGGRLMLDDDAEIRCSDDNCQRTWHLLDALWGCPNHTNPNSTARHQYEFKKASIIASVEAIRFACAKYKHHPGQAWFDRLMRSLENY